MNDDCAIRMLSEDELLSGSSLRTTIIRNKCRLCRSGVLHKMEYNKEDALLYTCQQHEVFSIDVTCNVHTMTRYHHSSTVTIKIMYSEVYV